MRLSADLDNDIVIAFAKDRETGKVRVMVYRKDKDGHEELIASGLENGPELIRGLSIIGAS